MQKRNDWQKYSSISLVPKNPNMLTNFVSLSVQLKPRQACKQENNKNESKSSTPSTVDSPGSTTKKRSMLSNQKYKTIFQSTDFNSSSVFKTVSKNILSNSNVHKAVNDSKVYRLGRTNSEDKTLKSKYPFLSKMAQEKLEKPDVHKIPVINLLEDISQHPFRHLVRGQNITRTKFLQFLEELQVQLKFGKMLKSPNLLTLRSKIGNFQQQNQSKPTLVLDLDETLIHSVANPRFASHSVQICTQMQRYYQFFNIRPYALELLRELSGIYEIIIFSASTKEYVTTICHYLDPEKKYISHILSRENCYITPTGYLIKDLRVLDNRNLQKILIVDNLAICFAFQLQNGIPILSWLGDQKDDELKYLIDYLKELSQEYNIAEKNYQNLQLIQLINKSKSQIQYGL